MNRHAKAVIASLVLISSWIASMPAHAVDPEPPADPAKYRQIMRSLLLDPTTTYERRWLTTYDEAGVYRLVRVIGNRIVDGGMRIYGIREDAAQTYVYSDDEGLTWISRGKSSIAPLTPKPQFPGMAPRIIQLTHICEMDTLPWKFAVTNDGRLLRNRFGENNWESWEDISISIPDIANGINGLNGLPANTTGRADIFVTNGSYLFYGNYNQVFDEGARVWRSGNCGSDWKEVLSIPVGEARHVHAIGFDPAAPQDIYVSVGDGVGQLGSPAYARGNGLWKSSIEGVAGSFNQVATGRYGINLVFPPANNVGGGTVDRVLLEGDGPNAPLLVSWDKSAAGHVKQLDALVWPDDIAIDEPVADPARDCAPADGPFRQQSWAGSGIGISLTQAGDLLLISSGESTSVPVCKKNADGVTCQTDASGAVIIDHYDNFCAIGRRDGIWLIRGPHFTQKVLLEDLSNMYAGWYGKSFQVGKYIFNGTFRIEVPKFKKKY